MNAQAYQALPIYEPFYGFPSNSYEGQRRNSETAIPRSPLNREQIGSVDSPPTNKATNLRNDGRVARHTQKRISCHLDLLEARTLTDMTDNTGCSANNCDRQQAFSSTGNKNFVPDPAMESPLLRKIKSSKTLMPPDQDSLISKNHAPSQTTSCPFNSKSSLKTSKDKSVELYKTEWCRNWQELGVCRYGKKCRYAHSSTELRRIERHPRYKTQICRTYHEKGTCPYGVRCTFIHEQQSTANTNIYQLEVTNGRHSAQNNAPEVQNLKTNPAVQADTTEEYRSAALPWITQPGINYTPIVSDKTNDTKELLPLSQIKNVVHSRSASNASWSPTSPNNIWGHISFLSELDTTTELTKRQKRSSSIASTSSFESSIFPADESSPELDRPTIYTHEQTGYISPVEDAIWPEFSWLSLKPDMFKRHPAACLAVDI